MRAPHGVRGYIFTLGQGQQPEELIEQRREEVDERADIHCNMSAPHQHYVSIVLVHQYQVSTMSELCQHHVSTMSAP